MGISSGKNTIHDTDFSDEEFDKMLALQFDGYENMSVSEYQNKVWELTDTAEYRDLLERLSKNEKLYEMRNSDESAAFLFYVLEPLTAERWQKRSFSGSAASGYSGAVDNAVLEYIITLEIQDADTLTVYEYIAARQNAVQNLENIIKTMSAAELRDTISMQEIIDEEINNIAWMWEGEVSSGLKISVEYVYMPLSGELATEDMDEWEKERPEKRAHAQENRVNTPETREYAYATEEDYSSLFVLKTPDYADMSVADFNRALLDWANETDDDRWERLQADIGWNDFQVSLDNEQLSFVRLTVGLSMAENASYVRSIYTEKGEKAPSHNQYLPDKTIEENGTAAWCSLWYQFSYAIADKKTLTVGERDYCISNMMSEIQDFWNRTDIEEILSMTKDDIVSKLKEIAAKYSNDNITIIIREDSVSFEKMDERSREFD